MSPSAEQPPAVTFAQYLADEQTSEVRHELVAGRVHAMAGGFERHDLTAGLVYERLAPGARAAGRRPFAGNRMLRAGEAGHYPDVLVVGQPAAHRNHEASAIVAVEVLSPSTQDVDRRERVAAHAVVEGLDLYLLIDPERERIEAGRRRGWHLGLAGRRTGRRRPHARG